MERKIFSIVGSFLIVGVAQAQFAGNAFFGVAPNTTGPATINNTLTVSNTTNGFVVAGNYDVTLPAGTFSGALLAFEADRPMQTAQGNLLIQVSIPGTDYIDCPVGNTNSNGGASLTVDNSSLSGSVWTIPTINSGTYYYNGGAGFSTSTVCNYAGLSGNFMRLFYKVSYNYSGAGGTYHLTFPLTVSATTVPEPVSGLVLGLGAMLVVKRRRR